jgi:gluconolactonase
MPRNPLPLCSLVTLGLAVTARGDAPPSHAAPPEGAVTKYVFDQSKIFPGTIRDYWVYVPKQYDPAKPACVYANQDGRHYNARLKVKGANTYEPPIKPAPPRL